MRHCHSMRSVRGDGKTVTPNLPNYTAGLRFSCHFSGQACTYLVVYPLCGRSAWPGVPGCPRCRTALHPAAAKEGSAVARFIDELKRTHSCGALRATRHRQRGRAVRLGAESPRPRRLHLHRPARPRRRHPAGVRPAEVDAAQAHSRVADQARSEWVLGMRGKVRSRGGNANPNLRHRRDRGGGHRGHRLQQGADAALRDRRQHRHQRGEAARVPLPRPAPSQAAEEHHDALASSTRPRAATSPTTASSRSRRRSWSSTRPAARATSWCRRACTRAASTRWPRARSCSSSC